MHDIIFTFVKPSPTSKATGQTIQAAIRDVTGASFCWGASVADAPIRVLFLMAGASAFCDVREALAGAIASARRVVWVQDDYTQKPPQVETTATSAYRLSAKWRADRKMPSIDRWTTVRPLQSETPLSRYVNWNALGYAPMSIHRSNRYEKTLAYYGVWRPRRKRSFEQFLSGNTPGVRRVVSTSAGGELAGWLKDRELKLEPPLTRPELIPWLSRQGAGLYIADEDSNVQDHSPARRFYEMLSAGLPMVFDRRCCYSLSRNGIDTTEYTIENPDEAEIVIKKSLKYGLEQFERWGGDWREMVMNQIVDAWKAMTEAES